MKHPVFVVAVISAVISQTGSLRASCPEGYLNEIFCDDFDSYCTTGGPPGTLNCGSDATKDNLKLEQVWYPLRDSGCFGTSMIVEDTGVIADKYSGKYTNPDSMGQVAIRDWLSSPAVGDAGQVLDIHRFIQNVHGSASNSVNGSNDAPLVMSFQMNGNVEKLFYSSGYMELAFGEHYDPLNRANTDYVNQNANCCGETGRAIPVVCAQANPGNPLPAGCPTIATNPPPVHRAIAIGAFSNLDVDPCDGCTTAPPSQYRQNIRHLTLFDGRVWWTLKKDGPLPPGAVVTGEIYLPKDGSGNPVSPPADFPLCDKGDFDLVSTLAPNSTSASQSYNSVTLTISATTFKVEHTGRIRASNQLVYYVTSTMDNIPRQYVGAFDRIRAGVGPGCALASNTNWSNCSTIDGRVCLLNNNPFTFVTFDKFILRGGVGVIQPGACCKANGTCAEMLQSECEALDQDGNPKGRFLGVGQPCDANVQCCPLTYGDMDQDHDVDMDDFAKLQTCLTLPSGAVSETCRCLDSDVKNGIGGDEILKFAQCANGPGMPGNAGASCRGPGW